MKSAMDLESEELRFAHNTLAVLADITAAPHSHAAVIERSRRYALSRDERCTHCRALSSPGWLIRLTRTLERVAASSSAWESAGNKVAAVLGKEVEVAAPPTTPGERMCAERARLGFTQERLALLTGISRVSIGKQERNVCSPKLDHLALLSALGFDITFIVTGARPAPWNKA